MKKKSRPCGLVLVAVLLTVSLLAAGCGNTQTSGDYSKYPEKGISLIVTASAGGGLDICARMLTPYLERALGDGAVVTVTNENGGANWVGWTQMMNAAPDGYTISTVHTPQVYSYLNKSLQNTNTLDSFNLLCNTVTDSVTVVVRTDDSRMDNINTLQDLVDFIKAHESEEFLVALTSKGGADEIAMLLLCEQAGITNLVGVNHSNGIAEAKASFLGGHVDFYFGKVGDSVSMYKDGDVKVLAVCKDERSSFLPDIATAIEQGYEINIGSSRGIAAQPGMDEELKTVIIDALRAAQEDPEYLESMYNAGYEVDYMEGDAYLEYMREQEALIVRFADQLGYND